MHATLIFFFLCAVSACAQPVWGPFTIAELNSVDRVGPQFTAVGGGDTAYVFYESSLIGQPNNVYWTAYSLASQALLRPVQTLGFIDGANHTLHDAMLLENGLCAVIVSRTMPGDSQISEALLYRLSATGETSNPHLLYRGFHIFPCWYSCFDLVAARFAPRSGGGFVIVAAEAARFQSGYDEIDFNPYYWVFSSGGALDWYGTFFPQTLFGSVNNWAVSLAPDTLLFLSTGAGWGDNFLGRRYPIMDSCADAALSCTIFPAGFIRTPGGRLIAASVSGYQAWMDGMFELHENGTCELLDGFGAFTSPVAVALHPDFGFAAVIEDTNGMILARFDTMGVEGASRGTLCVPEEDWEIASMACRIAPDGRVFVQFWERSLAEPQNFRLRLASVGWNTPLESSERDYIPHPSSFNLSAFPNPFNSALRIEYTLPHAAPIEIRVFNTLGQVVDVLESGRRSAGVHFTAWSPKCGSGIYWITLTGEGRSVTRKALFIQ